MRSTEQLHTGIENPSWTKELGIQAPLARIAIQAYYPSYSGLETARGLNPLERYRPTWLTTPVFNPEGDESTHELVSVIHSRGSASNLGFALPRRNTDLEPYAFFWNVVPSRPEIVKIKRVGLEGGWRHLLSHEDERFDKVVDFHTESLDEKRVIWRIGHPYVSPLVMQEHYLLAGFSGIGELKERLVEQVSPGNLVSGGELRGKRRRLGGLFPFEQLLGRFEPILVGEGRVFGRNLKRSQGFRDERPFVY
jgi:hypothetical protein